MAGWPSFFSKEPVTHTSLPTATYDPAPEWRSILSGVYTNPAGDFDLLLLVGLLRAFLGLGLLHRRFILLAFLGLGLLHRRFVLLGFLVLGLLHH